MSDHFDKLRAAIAQAEARALPPPIDANTLLRDLCQVLDPTKRNELRTLLQALTANKTESDMPSVTQAFLEQAPAVVGADLWHACCEKQRPRGDSVPESPDQPAAAGGGEDASPPDAPSDAQWRCNWCQILKTSWKAQGPEGPKTLCGKCNRRWRNGETGPRSDDWECDWCGADDSETPRRCKGPKGPATLCETCHGRHSKGATGPPAKDWRCDWCSETTGWRLRGPKGPGTLCDPCGARFRDGKTGPLSATFECRWCDATSTRQRHDGPTGEEELCHSCGTSYAMASAKIKARLVRVEKELVRLTSVLAIDVDAGKETRIPRPKRSSEAPGGGALKALKTVTDATAGKFAEIKSENAALEGQRDRNDATAAAASAAAATANAAAATANDDAEEAQDTLGYQVRFTDALQTKIDELHALACQVDPVAADAIKNRQAT